MVKEKSSKSVKSAGFFGPNFKRFLLLVGYTIAAIFLLVICNLSFGFMAKKFDLKCDLTSSKVFSLSDHAKDYLRNYDKKLKFIICDGGQNSYNYSLILPQQEVFVECLKSVVALNPNFECEVVNVPNEMEKLSKQDKSLLGDDFGAAPKVIEQFKDVKFLNTDQGSMYSPSGLFVIDETDPEHKKGFNLKSTDVVEGLCLDFDDALEQSKPGYKHKGKKIVPEKSAVSFERSLIGNLEKLSGKRTVKVAATNSHGEFDFTMNSDFFGDMGVSMEKVDLSKNDISSDFDVLLIAAPNSDFTKEELDKVDAFLKEGKGVVYCANAMQKNLADLEEFLKNRGIVFSDGCLVNAQNKEIGILVKLNLDEQKNVFTEKMVDQQYPLLLARCKPMRLENGQDGWQVSEICKTSPDYVAATASTTNLDELAKSEFVVAAMSQKELEPEKRSKIIALSSVDFVNGVFSQPKSVGFGRSYQNRGLIDKILVSNFDFTRMLFKEASGKDMLPCDSMKVVEETPAYRFSMSDEDEALKIKAYVILVCVIPVVFMLAGIVVWILRKRKK